MKKILSGLFVVSALFFSGCALAADSSCNSSSFLLGQNHSCPQNQNTNSIIPGLFPGNRDRQNVPEPSVWFLSGLSLSVIGIMLVVRRRKSNGGSHE